MDPVRNLYRAPVALLLLAAVAAAAPIDVHDGTLADWGVLVQDDNLSNINSYGLADWVAAGGAAGAFLGADREDSNDLSNSYYLGPNWGGQNYDAELLVAAIQGGKLHVAISTGQRPDNGFRYYSPGDLRIEMNDGTAFAVEVGGGAGGGAGGAITTGADGSTYLLSSGGYTTGHVSSGSQFAGKIYSGTSASGGNWIFDPISPKGPVQIDPDNPGTFVGVADYEFSRNSFTSQHSILEFGINLSLFGGDVSGIDSIHWRPSCGNDEVNLSLQINPVPEPGSFLLLAPAAVVVFVLRRRRKTS